MLFILDQRPSPAFLSMLSPEISTVERRHRVVARAHPYLVLLTLNFPTAWRRSAVVLLVNLMNLVDRYLQITRQIWNEGSC